MNHVTKTWYFSGGGGGGYWSPVDMVKHYDWSPTKMRLKIYIFKMIILLNYSDIITLVTGSAEDNLLETSKHTLLL